MRGDVADLHSGGRALPALVRPYARKVSGTPVRMSFNASDARRTFTFAFRHAEGVAMPTEVYVPHYQYPSGVSVSVSDGEWRLDSEQQTLYYMHGTERAEHTITLALP